VRVLKGRFNGGVEGGTGTTVLNCRVVAVTSAGEAALELGEARKIGFETMRSRDSSILKLTGFMATGSHLRQMGQEGFAAEALSKQDQQKRCVHESKTCFSKRNLQEFNQKTTGLDGLFDNWHCEYV
jgi:hypothetical protein